MGKTKKIVKAALFLSLFLLGLFTIAPGVVQHDVSAALWLQVSAWHSPTNPTSSQSVTIFTMFDSRGQSVSSVKVWYKVNAGSWTYRYMDYWFREGNFYNYRENIGTFAASSTVYYYVEARTSGGLGYSSTRSFSVAAPNPVTKYAFVVWIRDYIYGGQMGSGLKYGDFDSKISNAGMGWYNQFNSEYSDYTVQMLNNHAATESAIKSKLTAYASSVDSNDIFVFVFVGHGDKVSKDPAEPDTDLTLLAADAKHTWDGGACKDLVNTGAIWESEIVPLWNNIAAGKKLLILDCCYSGGWTSNYATSSTVYLTASSASATHTSKDAEFSKWFAAYLTTTQRDAKEAFQDTLTHPLTYSTPSSNNYSPSTFNL